MADQPVHELSREVVNMLTRAVDSGAGMVSLAQVQSELELGHDDAQRIMSQLVEQGIAENLAPGAWGLTDEEEAPARVQVRADVAEPSREDEVDELRSEAQRILSDAGVIGHGPSLGSLQQPAGEQVRLTRAMVSALEDAALGALVRAGVEGAGETPFLLGVF